GQHGETDDLLVQLSHKHEFPSRHPIDVMLRPLGSAPGFNLPGCIVGGAIDADRFNMHPADCLGVGGGCNSGGWSRGLPAQFSRSTTFGTHKTSTAPATNVTATIRSPHAKVCVLSLSQPIARLIK